MDKKKKHVPGTEQEKPRSFLNAVQWEWKEHFILNRDNIPVSLSTGEWIDPALDNWWFHIRNRVYKFHYVHFDEFDLFDGWGTIAHAEQMIEKCATDPVFPLNPSPMFLQRWLDTWIETMYCRVWCHIFDTLRLKKGVEEIDAVYRANVIGSEFEELFDPTFPRVPKAPKARRGSKRDRQMTAKTEEAAPAAIVAHQPEDYIELRGPDPSPYRAFQYCYRVLDRRDIEAKVQNIPGSEGRFYEGVKIAAMILSNDVNEAQFAADAAFREIRRRIVYNRLHTAEASTSESGSS
jgi:hypothetical protein